MNDMSDNPTPPQTLRVAYSETSELTILLAKILTLVAPTSMTTDQQELWLRAAIEALRDIRVHEIRAIVLELQRSVRRPNDIVPEISRLVDERRKRARQVERPESPFAAERAINEEAQKRRADATGDRAKMNAAAEWENDARRRSCLSSNDRQEPLTRNELDSMPAHVRAFGLKCGFLRIGHTTNLEEA